MLFDFSIARWTPEKNPETLSKSLYQNPNSHKQLARELRFKKARWNRDTLSNSTKLNHKSLLKIPIVSPLLPSPALKHSFCQSIFLSRIKKAKNRSTEMPSVSSSIAKSQVTLKCLKNVIR